MSPDFGPGHLPTSASQGIENTYILGFWSTLPEDRCTILELTLRSLPLTHFTCLEKVLQHLESHASSSRFEDRMKRRSLLRDLSTCSLRRMEAYLKILTTLGRDYTNPTLKTRYPACTILYQYSDVHSAVEDVEARNAREELARTREHAEWMNLQRAIQKLPVELNLLIRDALHEEVFGPGKEIIFPYEGPAYMEQFGALDRQLCEKYSHIYYCKNMWVISEGSPRWLIAASESTTPTILSRIRNLILKWTWKDSANSGPVQPNVKGYIDSEVEIGGAEKFDNLESMQRFTWACGGGKSELLHIWSEKSKAIGSMQLDKLVIDARDAFAPDGEYLGVEAAHRWAWSIHPPHCLADWAPEYENLAEQKFHIVADKYS